MYITYLWDDPRIILIIVIRNRFCRSVL